MRTSKSAWTSCPWWWAREGQDGKEDMVEGAVEDGRGNAGLSGTFRPVSPESICSSKHGAQSGGQQPAPERHPLHVLPRPLDWKTCHRIWLGKQEHYHLIPARMALIRKTGTKAVGEAVEKLGPHNCWCGRLENTMAVPQKVTRRVTMWSHRCPPRDLPKRSEKHTSTEKLVPKCL